MIRTSVIALIAKREVRERTRSRVFRIGTFLTTLIVVASVVFPALARDRDTVPKHTVGIVEPGAPQLATSIAGVGPSLGALVETTPIADSNAGARALTDDTIDVLVVPGIEVVTRRATASGVLTENAQLTAAVADVARLYAGFSDVGLDPERVNTALHREPLPVRGLEPANHRNQRDASAASAGMILLFVFLTLYGAFILNGVIEEKTSRVVEILLATVRADELLIGKVVGIGVVGTLQGIILVVATIAARTATPGGGTSLTPAVMAYTLLWFALGFGMFAWLYACAGALVSRSEDAQNLVFPLQLPLVASYVVGLMASFNGPNPVLNAMSMFPLTAPLTMLERMAAQQVPWWQVLVSVSLCVATSYAIMKLAITIFAGGILRSGQRVKLRDAWRG